MKGGRGVGKGRLGVAHKASRIGEEPWRLLGFHLQSIYQTSDRTRA